MAVLMLLTTATAWADPTGNWADYKAASLTESDDHETIYISTAAELALYAYNVNYDVKNAKGYYCARTVELQADIDLSAHYWTPIGNRGGFYFNGKFNGNGHVITGMTVTNDCASNYYGFVGFFKGQTDNPSHIDNLIFRDCYVTGNVTNSALGGVGIVVGYMNYDGGGAVTNCLVVDCSVTETDIVNSHNSHGAIIGCANGYSATNNYYYNMSGDYGAGMTDFSGTTAITTDVDGVRIAYAATLPDGQQHEVSYVDANDNGHTAQAIALDGTKSYLDAGTYFVGLPEVNFNHGITLNGNVTLILCDGKTMNVGKDGAEIDNNGITGADYTLDIYSQSLGDDMGTLSIYTEDSNNRGIDVGAITINGGNITVNSADYDIYANSDITINGGHVTVTVTDTGSHAIYAKGNFNFSGGTVTATATAPNSYGIHANGTITLGWNKPTDRIYASSYSGTVSVKDGLAFVTDKATPAVIGGTISDLAAINGKTLKPATFYLVGNMTNPEWTVNADYQLTVNPENTSELMIQNVPLTGSTEFKVVYSANGTEATTWYPGDGYNYWISADGIYDIYFRPDYQGGDDWHYGCIYATDVSNIEVAFAPEGFAAYYHGTFDVKLPEGVKARIVTARGDSEGTLTYETIADGDTNDKVVPAGTAVMLQTEKSTEAQQKTLTLAAHGANSPAAPAVNLLHGHDADGKTIGDGKHYKLTYGNDNTPNADVFGWYWGAADGAAFTLAGHKAWLVLPADANARSFFGLPDDETTGVVEMRNEQGEMRNSDAWYDLSGRKLDNGQRSMVNGQWSKGVYIHNGRKVVIK